MKLGLFSFVETEPDGSGRSPQQRFSDLMEEAVLADQLGLDVFGIGEHHRPDYLASAPAVLLAAAAAQTERIRLTSTVTVLSSDDPVRVFQQFATLDQLSGGRAEIMAGRGSFTESFPLFGYALQDYEALFDEKLEMLLKLRERELLTWTGQHTQSLKNAGVYPRPLQDPLPVWRAVGGSPQSVVQAGTLGLPLMLAIIGGHPARFKPLVELYREAARRAGHGDLPVGISGHGFLADSKAEALDIIRAPFSATMNRIGAERGWPPMGPGHLEREASLEGALVAGSPQEVVDKILYQHELFGHERTLLQLTVGPIPHADVLRAIELFGDVVAPAVRKALAVPA